MNDQSFNTNNFHCIEDGVVGVHVLAEFCGCDAIMLDNIENCIKIMDEAVMVMQAKKLGHVAHQFTTDGGGVTICYGLGESHLTIHSWPMLPVVNKKTGERAIGYILIDCCTCGLIDPSIAIDYMLEKFSPKWFKRKRILRGPNSPDLD